MTNRTADTIPWLDDDELRSRRIRVGVHRRTEDGTPFVVLRGRAIVEVEEGESLVYLRPGTMCQFSPVLPTRWTVSEEIELITVTEAAIVFKEHDEQVSADGRDVRLAHLARPFRPRRRLS